MNSARSRSLADFARSAGRHKMALILPALVVSIASAIALWMVPSQYRSSARLIAETPKPDPELLGHLREQATSRPRLAALIELRNLYQDERQRGASLDDLSTEMRKHINVESESGKDQERLFRISFSANNPRTAWRVTADLADELVAESVKESRSSTGEVEELEKEIGDLAARLRELEQTGRAVHTGQPRAAATLPNARSAQPSGESFRGRQIGVESLRDQQYTMGQQIADLDKRIALQRQIVDSQKKSAVQRDNPTYALLIARRAELQGQRDNLLNRQELTDKHPRVLVITDQITAINNQLEELRKQDSSAISQTPEARELLALESDRRRMQLQFELAGREINRHTSSIQPPRPAAPVSAYSTEQQSFAQEYLDLKQRYADAAERLRIAQVKADSEASTSTGSLRLLESAILPRIGFRFDRLLLVFLAAAVGLALGAGFTLALDYRRRQTVHDASDVEYYARLPLLGAIPTMLSPEERRRRNRRARLVLVAEIAGAVLATVGLTRLLIVIELFARLGNG